jgi:TatD DNase family protein
MKQFDPDREEVIKRARAAGVDMMITVGSDLMSTRAAIALAEEHEGVYATVGVHPHDAKHCREETLDELAALARHPKVVAVGETGLDYHYDHSPREVQREVMERHLEMAFELDKPVVVHSREAAEDTMRILEEAGVGRGVMHCFSGDREMAERAMAMGLHISVAGPVTFKKAAKLAEVVRAVPDEFLLLETDAPYLTPEPHRGKRNEPAYVAHTAARVAELRGVSVADVARITTLNAARLFGVGEVPAEGEIAYPIRESLYLNLTNRCTNRCGFCVRFESAFVKGHNLRLKEEPTVEELTAAIGDPTRYREVVFCGYGEPTLRLEVVKAVARWVKERGGRVRLNTNGHGSLIHGRDITAELEGLVDAVSVSLDAPDAETYERVCRPERPGAFEAVVGFIRSARAHIPDVQVTVVAAEGVDVGRCRQLAAELGVPLRVRELHVVG